MFQKFFTSLYEAILGSATPASLIPTYRQGVFPSVGLFTAFVAGLGLALLFYLVLNRLLVTSFFKTKHWLLVMGLAAVASSVFAYTQAKSVVFQAMSEQDLILSSLDQAAYNRYGWGFVFVNALVGAFFFVLWSFAIKWASVSARTTPVRWLS
ncbi:hypothetical protein [Hymenobacter sp. 102]|uniref:hypothetical protein n=1 Tax=Hymenobacter sp. 102 TaxID=3403152 RepID=UPI003CEDAA00